MKWTVPRAAAPLALALIGAGLVAPGFAADGAPSTATGISREFNPAISVNTLLLGQTSRDRDTAQDNGVRIQEMEIQITSIVDPFWDADITLAVHPEHEHEEEAHGEEAAAEHGHGGTNYVWDVETAVLRYRNMPRGLALRAGKFFLPFGRHLPLHTHQFPFVHAPIGLTAFTGDHGPAEVGAELGATVPLPWWSDLRVYGVDGRSEFLDGEDRELAFGTRWSNLWDLSEAATLELGGSALLGPAAHHEEDPAHDLRLYGLDATLKWIASDVSQGRAVNLTAELLLPRPEDRDGDPLGWYAHLQYRFTRDWWLGLGASEARDVAAHEHEEEKQEEDHAHLHTLREVKANLTWTPSEFSSVRGEISYQEDPDGDFEDLRFALQVNVTIGSHPAHLY